VDEPRIDSTRPKPARCPGNVLWGYSDKATHDVGIELIVVVVDGIVVVDVHPQASEERDGISGRIDSTVRRREQEEVLLNGVVQVNEEARSVEHQHANRVAVTPVCITAGNSPASDRPTEGRKGDCQVQLLVVLQAGDRLQSGSALW